MGTAFVQWLDNTPLSDALRAAPWRFPLVEIFHLVGLVVWFGSVLVVDLRLLGVMLQREPAAEVAEDLAPIAWAALAVQFVSGPMMFMATAVKTSEKLSWRIKLSLLAVALLYHFTVHRKVISAREGDVSAIRRRAVAGMSLALWTGVALAGLWINA